MIHSCEGYKLLSRAILIHAMELCKVRKNFVIDDLLYPCSFSHRYLNYQFEK